MNVNQPNSIDPPDELQAAIEKLDLFTSQDAADLEIQEDGKLIPASRNPLEKIVELMGSILSNHVRQEQGQKRDQIKQEILQARDMVKSYFPLFKALEQDPDPAKRQWGQSALKVIERYNQAVKERLPARKPFPYEVKKFLLSDDEIKGQTIELPVALSVKYDSHAHLNLAQKTLYQLSSHLGIEKPTKLDSSIAHLPPSQLILDAFRTKAISLIRKYYANESMGEIIPLVKQNPVHVQEENQFIHLYQMIEVTPGAKMTLTGSFKHYAGDSKFMSVPIAVKDSFRLIFESTQTGFPYPSHLGWTLSSELVDAYPLRADQVPLFQEVEMRRKALAEALIYDSGTIAKVKQATKIKKELFDQQRADFLPLHQALHEELIRAAEGGIKSEEQEILNAFYRSVEQASSSFNFLVHIQECLINGVITQPAQKLQEVWLQGLLPELCSGEGEASARNQMARQILVDEQNRFFTSLGAGVTDGYLKLIGTAIGQAAQSIICQYASDKMGIIPPMLNDFERKIQICAFQQLLSFLDEFTSSSLDAALSDQNDQERLQHFFNNQRNLLACSDIEQLDILAAEISTELEIYFNTRFYV